jgi:hypothetical protein
MLRNITDAASDQTRVTWAVRPIATGVASGWLSLMDIQPRNAAIELGRQNNRMDVVSTWIRRYLTTSEGRAAKELLVAVARGKITDLWGPVAGFLNDSDPLLRRTAAITLQSIPTPEAADLVVNRLAQEDDTRTLLELMRAAGQIKSLTAVPALLHLLRSSIPEVVTASSNALSELTGQKFGTDTESWNQWWTRNKPN